ncbi:unnamed protein product [Gongylonema pulchrum]|uniref:Anoctamin n=1 Tax=Gongylonema pulchrum TaxID=637853 RepID=A0A183EUB4_9BILA|nr:unnamed protein product [Gongylonema pulchrum]VDN42995.1 unnamed protein product [Gongylonema pulchrum]
MKQLTEYGEVFEELFTKSFYHYGLLVGRYPGRFLAGSLLFTVICITGLPALKINLDLYKLFVPLDAPVREEYDRFFYPF